MRRAAFEVIRALLWVVWWFWSFPEARAAKRSYRRHLRAGGLRRVGGIATPRFATAAIVCFSYRHTRSLKRLLSALHDLNVDVYLICNRAVSSDELSAFESVCVEILERPNFGWDWGAYREGYLRLRAMGTYADADLVFANDSVYFVDGADEQVRSLLHDEPGSVRATSVNYEGVLHAQAFLMRIPAGAAFGAAVSEFFDHYRVRFGKIHSINRGEIKLSQVLADEGYLFSSVNNSSRLLRTLEEQTDFVPEWWWEFQRHGVAREDWQFVRWNVARMAETQNSTTVLGLALTRYLHAPLKLDLTRWAHAPHFAAQILDALRPVVDGDDLHELERWFMGRPNWSSYRGLRRAFYIYGIR